MKKKSRGYRRSQPPTDSTGWHVCESFSLPHREEQCYGRVLDVTPQPPSGMSALVEAFAEKERDKRLLEWFNALPWLVGIVLIGGLLLFAPSCFRVVPDGGPLTQTNYEPYHQH